MLFYLATPLNLVYIWSTLSLPDTTNPGNVYILHSGFNIKTPQLTVYLTNQRERRRRRREGANRQPRQLATNHAESKEVVRNWDGGRDDVRVWGTVIPSLSSSPLSHPPPAPFCRVSRPTVVVSFTLFVVFVPRHTDTELLQGSLVTWTGTQGGIVERLVHTIAEGVVLESLYP